MRIVVPIWIRLSLCGLDGIVVLHLGWEWWPWKDERKGQLSSRRPKVAKRPGGSRGGNDRDV